MRRTITVLAVLLAAILMGGPAWAKGPDRATVSGPGLAGAVDVRPDREGRSPFLDPLREASGIHLALFEEYPGTLAKERPEGDLGPRYRIAWHVPWTGDGLEVVQDVYPYATPRLAVHTAAQEGVERSGWYAAPALLKATLVALGLPERPPATPPAARPSPAATPAAAAGPSPALTIALPLAVGALAGAGVISLVTRRRRTSPPVV
ncbi:hypothetical protein [Sphaerisporangium sp. TRM90804]|uniref:hypothetical protein n=1 Tax=Sphaerisporangium sp. TRM90804 TaxID=3031113 RepID=UPI00244B96AC|nr:hypothetical protein [Sphaerisporangium sp. TRM90804]MDH2427324.1 hypothetical protein [Sphaerisporangium sp. TRM90804]